MPDQSKQPAFVVAILALLGVASLPTFLKSPDAGKSATIEAFTAATSPAGSASSSDDSDESTPDEPNVRDLKPLVEYLSDGKRVPKKNQQLAEYFCSRLRDTMVYCLVISLPDPVESVASGRFDEDLDVVQRAIELQGYILDRTLLPWKRSSEDKSSSGEKSRKVRLPNKQTIFTIEPADDADETKNRSGLMVFKRLIDPDPKAELSVEPPAVLLAFLVPESPIAGIDKRAFRASLDLIDLYFRVDLTREGELGQDGVTEGAKPILHIIAPCFNASQRSLETALAGWKPASGRSYHFRVISGSSHMIETRRLKSIVESNSAHKLTFHSMVHRVHEMKDAIFDYLVGTRQGDTNETILPNWIQNWLPQRARYQPGNIAVMVESNSGLAQALVQKERNLDKTKNGPASAKSNNANQAASPSQQRAAPVEFLFPLQVGGLRKAYEKAGLLGDKPASSSGAVLKLRIPANEAGAPGDLPQTFTPATSAALDELELTQVLTTIARRPYQAVGVFATDPFDVVFLAQQVSRFCPNVRLFTLNADLLLTRPGDKVDLRGMIVASTYSLYPSNQWMTTPYHDGPRVFFGNRGSQGLYNATVAHLWELGADKPKQADASAPQLLEYGLPYDITAQNLQKPPVWISVVGERGIYPVKFVPPKDDSGYLYQPQSCLELRTIARWLPVSGRPINVAAARHAAARAAKASPYLPFWLISLFLMLACGYVAALTLRYVEWSRDPRKYERNPKARVFAFGHALRWLNCDVAKRGPIQLLLIEKDTDLPAADKRHDMIVIEKSKKKLSIHVFDDGGSDKTYNQSALMGLSRQVDTEAPRGLFEKAFDKVLDLRPFFVRRFQLFRLQRRLKPLWSQRLPSHEDQEEIIDSLIKITGDRLVPFAYRNPQDDSPLAGQPYDPQLQFTKIKRTEAGSADAAGTDGTRGYEVRKSAFPPPVGAGPNVALLNLVVAAVSSYIFVHVIFGMYPLDYYDDWPIIPFTLMTMALVAIFASTFISLTEACRTPPNEAATQTGATRGGRAGRSSEWWRHFAARLDADLTFWVFFITFALASLFWAAAIAPNVWWTSVVAGWFEGTDWRIPFERFTNLTSGVTPVFPVFFLALTFALGIFFQLSRRRLYRASYLPSQPKDSRDGQGDAGQGTAGPWDSPYFKILVDLRTKRTEVNRLITRLRHALRETKLWIQIAVIFLIGHIVVRCGFRGFPRSLETRWFDWVYWPLFGMAYVIVIARAMQLATLWRRVRQMLQRAVQVPLSRSYDRMPARFNGWFFGEDDFSVREQLIRQQSNALLNRCTEELAKIFQNVENLTAEHSEVKFFPCRIKGDTNKLDEVKKESGGADGAKSEWLEKLKTMRSGLDGSSTLDSTRTIYPFLIPLWGSRPVEDVPKSGGDDKVSAEAAEWVASWPLTPWQRDKLKCDKQLILLRDWARMAEDLLALQIVRWIAPPLSHLVPMMQFIVLASLSLLLAAMSYPFDHQGWLTIMMVCLIVFVGVVVTTSLVGINRDELISRVSDTTPGRLTFDSKFLTSVMTTLGPLVGALLALSFDISDLLRAWFGPLLQFF